MGNGKNKRGQRVTKAPFNGAEKNTIKQVPLLVSLELRFTDPDDEVRAFPKKMVAEIVFGDNQLTEKREISNDEGKLVFTVARAIARKYKFFRIKFAPAQNNYIVCEKSGEATKKIELGNKEEADDKAKEGARFFRMPPQWSFLTSDWTVETDEKNYDKAVKEKKFLLADGTHPKDIGSREQPIKALLDPHWQFLKFEYFDRYYGHSDHGNEPVSIPPATIEGFSAKSKTSPDSRSNWTINPGDDEKKKVQCLPWIVQAKADGTALPKPDKDSLLQFNQPKDTYVISKSATERTIKSMIAPLEKDDAEALRPCANRLKYYDLPELWKSPKYWCRLSDDKAEQGFFEKMCEKKTEKAKPLIFSLDDIILTDDKIAPLSMQQTDKLVLFYHEFMDGAAKGGRAGAKYLKNGLYRPGPDKVAINEQSKIEKDAREKAEAKRKEREEQNAREKAEAQAEKTGAKRAEIKKAGDDAVAALANDKEIQDQIKAAGDKAAPQATKNALREGKIKESTENLKVLALEEGQVVGKARANQRTTEEKPHREEAEEKQRKIEEQNARKAAMDAARKNGLPQADINAAGDRAIANLANDKEAQSRIKTAGNNATTSVNSDTDAKDRINAAGKGAAESAVAFPYSDIVRDEKAANYVFDYPHWTRLLVYNGNLFDNFDKRTTTGDVIGARAAVRWVDATPDGIGVAAGVELNPRPDLTPAKEKHEEAYFIVQPYFEQSFFSRSHVGHSSNRPTGAYDEWGSPVAIDDKIYKNARTDMVLLRTSNYKDTNEENVVFRFHRLSFNFTAQESLLNPSVPTADIEDQRIKWTSNFVTTCADRWNGDDSLNNSRAWIIEDKNEDPKIRAQVVSFIQEVSEPKSHFKIETIPESGTSSMNSVKGTGVLRKNAGAALDSGNFAAAHEIGHAGGQPDDYAPSVKGQTGFGSNHITGGPFIPDVNAMMKGNKQVRGRSFWHITEWLRQIEHLKDTKFQIEHNALTYKIPHYNHADRPGRNYAHWNLKGQVFYRPQVPVLYDSFLYCLGKDEYSQVVLPSQPDGIIVVMLKMLFEFTGYSNDDQAIEHIFSKINQKIDNALNTTRVHAQFNLAGIDRGGTNTFEKCMLHFSPRFEVTGGNPAHLKIKIKIAAGGGDVKDWFYVDGTAWSAANTDIEMHAKLDAGSVKDNTRVIYMSGGTEGTPADAKDVPEFEAKFKGNVTPRTFDFCFPDDSSLSSDADFETVVTRFENLVFKHFCSMLGLSDKSTDANYYQNANAYKNIVKGCVNDNSLNPTMSR